MNCPQCGSKAYGPGPNYDNFRWVGCYDCGYGFKDHGHLLTQENKAWLDKVMPLPKRKDKE